MCGLATNGYVKVPWMIVDVLGVTSGTHYDRMRELPLRYGKESWSQASGALQEE